uniref:Nedd4 family interacting protein 1 n=1 Tax=Canis lupus familiaris TaxID=9615 RepID=A0A8C0Q934_CANLF
MLEIGVQVLGPSGRAGRTRSVPREPQKSQQPSVTEGCGRGSSTQLQNEEEPGEPEQAVGDAPPPYSSISAESAAYFDYKDECGFPKPPSYNVATTLPTYDEAERTKAEATIPLVPGRDEDFVGRDDFDDADQLRIGNDGIFMLTFFMAFLFNWIGFFLSFCLTTSAAGRYGAISGFGLSLIKWILIVRFSTYFPGYFDGQYWLWWVFLVLDVFWQRPSCVYEFSLKKQGNTCRK